MTFSLRAVLLIALVIFLLAGGYGELRYLNGWYAHADHINALAAGKRAKAEKAIQPAEQKAAQASDEGRIVYRTITRDVVKYVQDPNRTVCKFDDDAIRMRQQAINAANSIPGFDAAPVQGK